MKGKTYNFLKECSVFFLATINDDKPALRPFGACMEYNDEIYFSTSKNKDVYIQLKKEKNIQIVALKSGTRDWLRINGQAVEVTDLNIKQIMLEECPILLKRFESRECNFYSLFKIINMESLMNGAEGIIKF